MWCNARIIGDSVVLKFNYDPGIIQYIKQYCERSYNPDTREWTITDKDYVNLKNVFCNSYQFNESVVKIEKFKPNLQYHFDVEDIKLKLKPLPHQLECIDWHINFDKSLNGSTMGTGKTLISISAALWRKKYNNIKHCLIICGVNGNKYNWNDVEIPKTCEEKPFLFTGNGEERYAQFEHLPDNFFLICNIETLRLKTKKPIIDLIKQKVDSGEIGMIIFDEIHKCRDPQAQQTKALLKLKPKYAIAMSGTIVVNSPLDCYIPMRFVDKTDKNYYQFKNFYCRMGGYMDKEVIGYKNLQYLQQQLDSCMIRFNKNDISDLPEKVYKLEYVEMTQKQTQVYREMCMNIYRNLHKIKRSNNPLAMLTHLRQTTGYTGIVSDTIYESAKLDRMEELVKEIVDNNEKVIIYSIWSHITDEIMVRLKEYSPLLYTGGVDENRRREVKNIFMTDDKAKVLVGTISALGTGETLTAANNVIFVDEPWNRASKNQAEDRVHRVGQNKSVNIITIIAKNTIDETVHKIVEDKGKISDKILDGIEPKDQMEIVNEVFEREIEYGNISPNA